MQHLVTLIACHLLDHEDKCFCNFMAVIWSLLLLQAVFCLFVKNMWGKICLEITAYLLAESGRFWEPKDC